MLCNIMRIPFAILLAVFVLSLPTFSATGRRARFRDHLTHNLVANNAVEAKTDEEKKQPTVAILLVARALRAFRTKPEKST